MKRISILLAISLLLGIPAQAAAPALFQYQSSQLGFSVTVPGIRQDEIIAEETDTGVNFYHVPSREKYGGEIGSIVVVSPRSDFFSGHYDDMAYQIIAMGKNQVFLWKTPGGGAHRRRLDALSTVILRLPWRIAKAWPRLSRMDGRSSKQ
ncbi:MAG: hypothetical protein ACLUS6_08225 [Dysosmobacter sp.]